jgi:hypothetical protein
LIKPGQQLKLPATKSPDQVQGAAGIEERMRQEAVGQKPGAEKAAVAFKDPILAKQAPPRLSKGITGNHAIDREALGMTQSEPRAQAAVAGQSGKETQQAQAAKAAEEAKAAKEARDTATVNDSVESINKSANQIQGLDKPSDGSGSEKDARRDATLAATQNLEDTLKGVPPELRGQVLEQSGEAIEKMTRGINILDGGDTKKAVGNLSNATETAGRENAHLVTDPVAKQIAAGGLEEHGSFGGRHDHRSEQEFANGVRSQMKDSGNDLFARSLANQLVANGDTGFAHALAKGGDVPGKNWAESIQDAVGGATNAVGGALGEVTDFVGDVANAGGDFARNKIAEAAGIDDRVRDLNSTGDKFTLGLGGEIGAFGIQGGAAADMEVEKTDDGYTLTVSGEASAGVFAALGTEGTGAKAEASATGKVSVEATFKTQQEAIDAAKTIAGIGIGTAIGGPIGAAVTGGTAGDEIKDFTNNISKTRIELEVSGSVGAGIGTALGLGDNAGIGGHTGVEAAASVALEIRPGQPAELVFGQELSGHANLNLGSNSLKLPDGRNLSLAQASAAGSLSLETRVPLGGTSVGDAMRDPLGAVKDLGEHGYNNATTTLSANIDVSGDIGLSTFGGQGGLNRHAASFAGGGLNAQISAEVPTKDLGAALGAALSGDLPGALSKLGDGAEISLEVNAIKETGFDIDESFNAGVFKIGVQAEYQSRDEVDIYDFKGSPAELMAEGAGFLDAINPLD